MKRAVGLLTAASFVAMGAGFLREVAIAYHFGTGGDADAFALVMFYVDGISALAAVGVAGYLLVPVLAAIAQREGEDASFRLFESTLLWLALLTAPVAGFVAWQVDAVATAAAPGFDPARHAAFARLLLLAVPTGFLLLAGGVLSGVLQARRDYYSPVLARAAFAIVTAAAVYLGAGRYGILAAGVGLLAGGILQFAWQVHALRRVGWRPRRPRLVHSGLTEAVRAAVPTLLALVLIQIVMGGAQRVAGSGLPDGAFSSVNYAQRLQNLLSGVTVALATVSLTELSVRFVTEGIGERTMALLRESIEAGLWLLIPLTALLLLTCEPLIALLFRRGRYDLASLQLTAACLRWLAVSIVPGMVLAVLHRAAPAFGRPWRATMTSVVWTVVTVFVTLALLPSLGAEALPAGYSAGVLAACLTSIGLLADLVPVRAYLPSARYAARMTALTLPATAAAAGALLLLPARTYGFSESATRLLGSGAAFGLVAVAAAVLAREPRTLAACAAIARGVRRATA